MSTQEIIDMALKLKPQERARVMDLLHQSLDEPDPEIDRLWGEEALRRLQAHRNGELGSVPMEAIFSTR